jgi:hypothetical protein
VEGEHGRRADAVDGRAERAEHQPAGQASLHRGLGGDLEGQVEAVEPDRADADGEGHGHGQARPAAQGQPVGPGPARGHVEGDRDHGGQEAAEERVGRCERDDQLTLLGLGLDDRFGPDALRGRGEPGAQRGAQPARGQAGAGGLAEQQDPRRAGVRPLQ